MHLLKIMNSELPRTETFPGGLNIGSQLTIQGSTHSNADRLTINLLCGPKNIVFHVTVDFVFEICRYTNNSTRNRNWCIDQSHGEISLVLGRPFIIYITFDRFHFTVRSNQSSVHRFSHQQPASTRITHLRIDGRAVVTEIRLNRSTSFVAIPGGENRSCAAQRPESSPDGDSDESRSPDVTKIGGRGRGRRTETLRTPRMSRVFNLPRVPRLPKILETLRLHKILKIIRNPAGMCPMPKFLSVAKMFSLPKITKRPHNLLPKVSYIVSETSSLNPFFLQIIK